MQIEDKLIKLRPYHKYGKYYIKLDDIQLRAVSELNKKILGCEMSFEAVPCLCNNDKFSLIASRDRCGIIQSTVICKKCGLIQSNPRMTAENYRFFYESDEYRRLYEGNNFLKNYETFYTNGCGDSIFQTLIKHKNLKDITSVLEFGAGGGWNLLPFIKQEIFVKGYDFSRELVKMGKRKNINLVQGSLSDIEGKYDIIILNHVLEHLTDFKTSVKKLKQHLNTGGIFYIAVPDIKNFSMGQLQAAHTYYFSLLTLQYYMAQCGLKMISNGVAEKIHLYAIFEDGGESLNEEFLSGQYEEMKMIIKKYSLDEICNKLSLTRYLKTVMRPIFHTRLGLKVIASILKLVS